MPPSRIKGMLPLVASMASLYEPTSFIISRPQCDGAERTNTNTKPKPKSASQASEDDYAKVALPFDDKCPFCQMMKRSPCNDAFVRFHQCAEYHQTRGEDIIKPCAERALFLHDCIQSHKEYFPDEVKKQKPKLQNEKQ